MNLLRDQVWFLGCGLALILTKGQSLKNEAKVEVNQTCILSNGQQGVRG